MSTKHGAALVITLIVVATAMTAASCGEEQPKQPGAADIDAFLNVHPVDLVLGDCSASFRGLSQDFVPEMVLVAQDSAERQRTLWAGCADGAPLRTLDWNPKVDFGEIPEHIASNDGLVERFNQARALGLGERFAELLKTPAQVAGSGHLEALELISQTAGAGRAFLFTDAITHEMEGINLGNATPHEIRQVVELWTPRMGDGLRDVQITMAGVGRGAVRTVAVRNAKTLLRGIVGGAGGTLIWAQELPPDL